MYVRSIYHSHIVINIIPSKIWNNTSAWVIYNPEILW
jgi:hypothetical protein